MRADREERRRGWWLVPAMFALLAGGGCSQWQGSRPRQPADRASWSTLGTDRSTIPRGQTIPPAGFGVDLVESSSRAARSRPLLNPALLGAGTARTEDAAVNAAGF